MVKIRLRRVGAKNNPKYRVVVADSRAARDGRFIEVVGHYDPVRDPELLELKQDRIREWLKLGAQPTDGALKLFYKAGLMVRPEKPGTKGAAPQGVTVEAPKAAGKTKVEAQATEKSETPKTDAKAVTKEKK